MMQKRAAILFVIGSLGFIGGALCLAPTGFFDAADDAARIAAIDNNRLFWTIAWLVLPLGGMTAAAGMLAEARHFGQIDDRSWLSQSAYVVAAAATIGAFTYVINGFFALTASAERYTAVGGSSLGTVLFMTYSVTTLLALTSFGVLLFLRGRRILGGFLVVAVVLSLVSGMWVFPLTNYAPLLITGLVLVMRPGRPLEAGTPARRPVST
jgi:hypothetical protein